MEGIINKEVREYIINTACRVSNRNRAFRKAYGKDFIKNRINENLNEVFTDVPVEVPGLKGYYNAMNKNIKIFLNGKNNRLTITDIKKKKLTPVLMHELIHAALIKNEEECKKLALEIFKYRKKAVIVKVATGILVAYDNKIIGRGLNEGLTNWLCENFDQYNKDCYTKLTNIVYQLENAVGKNKIMKWSRGRN